MRFFRHPPLALAVVAGVALLAAGCGGSASPGVARSPDVTSAATTSAAAATTTVRYGSTGASAGALAFARCMRAHGVPDWPDPESSGVFDKSKLQRLSVSPAEIRAIEERSCQYDFEPGGQGSGTTITPADRTDYLKAAACMRRHGFPTFPDPTFPDNQLSVDIPSSIDQTSSQYVRAATICTKLIPRGLPYSKPPGS